MDWSFVTVMASFAAVAIVNVYTAQRRRRALERSWRQAAEELGLTPIPGSLRRIHGTFDGCPVEIAFLHSAGYVGARTSLAVAGPGMTQHLSVRAESLAKRVGWSAEAPDLQTGDTAFDQAVHITGDEAATLALLDPTTRDRLADFATGAGGQIEAGTLRVELPGHAHRRGELLARVRAMVALAGRLTKRKGVPAQAGLLRNVQQDPLPDVRIRNLQALVRHFPRSPEAERACTWALDHLVDPEPRPPEGHDVDPAPGDRAARRPPFEPVRIAALEHLVATLQPQRLLPLLDRVLAGAHAFLHPAAIGALARLGPQVAFDRIAARAADANAATAGAVADALAAFADPRAEPVLVRLLRHAEVPVRVRAAAALGRVGTIHAVEPLLACERSASLLAGDVRQAARAAIEAIQGRLGAPGGGRLSLAGTAGAAGALSVAPVEGALSVSAEGMPAPPDLAPAEDTDGGAAERRPDRRQASTDV